jgi:hypothetical protein
MRKYSFYLLLVGLGLTGYTAYLYFSSNEEKFMNKLVLTLYKSFHFNCTPMMGVFILALGELILWKTKNNENLNRFRNKIIYKCRLRMSVLQSII